MFIRTKDSFHESNNQKIIKRSPWPKVISMLAISALVIVLFIKLQPNFDWGLFKKHTSNFSNFSAIELGYGKNITMTDTFIESLKLLGDTLAFSFLGTLIGVLIAIPLSLLSSKNIIKNKFIYNPIRWIMSIIRSIPPLVYAFMLVLLFKGSLAATMALSIFVSSITVKWLYEYLDTINLDTYNSLIALGLSKPRAILKAVVPGLLKKVVSFGLYAFEMVIRFATILALIGVKTIGYLMGDTYKGSDRWGHLLVVITVLVITIIFIEVLTIIIKKYVLSPKLKQANISQNDSFIKQLEDVEKQKSKAYIFQRLFVLAILGMAVYSITRVEFGFKTSESFAVFKTSMKNLFNPDWTYITEFGTGVNAIELGMKALLVALGAAVLGAILGLLFGILGSSNITGKYFSWVSKIFIIIVRSVPTFVYAFIFVLAAHENQIWVGVLAMGIRSIGMLGKLTYEKIESVDPGGKISMDVSGNNIYNSTRIAVIADAIPALVSNALYRIEINFKTSVELGVVGASPFGAQILIMSGSGKNYDKLTPYIIVTIILVLSIELISTFIRKKIMNGHFIDSSSLIKKYFVMLSMKRTAIVSMATNSKMPTTYESRKYSKTKYYTNKYANKNINKETKIKTTFAYKKALVIFNASFKRNKRAEKIRVKNLINTMKNNLKYKKQDRSQKNYIKREISRTKKNYFSNLSKTTFKNTLIELKL